MSLRYWHDCKGEMPEVPPVHHSDEIGWFIVMESTHDPEPISHCPWCGDELPEATSPSYASGKRRG